MVRSLAIGTLLMTLAACAGTEGVKSADSTGASASSGTKSTSGSPALASGTRIEATIEHELSSRVNKSGETVRAKVTSDVADGSGRVVIPAGSTVNLVIDKLEPGSDQTRPEGRLMIDVQSITVRGDTRPVDGTVGPIAHVMKGRGITKDEAGRIAIGTAAGAIVGQVIGKDTKSTVIGGAVGTVAGGAVAVRYAYRDVVVAAGTPVVITLGDRFISAK